MRTPYRKLEKTKLFNSRRISDDSCPNRAGGFRTAIRQCTVLEPHSHNTELARLVTGLYAPQPVHNRGTRQFFTLFTGECCRDVAIEETEAVEVRTRRAEGHGGSQK